MKISFFYYIYLYVYRCESQRALIRVGSPLLVCGFWGSNSGRQAWLQGPLPTEPSHQPFINSHFLVLTPLLLQVKFTGPHTPISYLKCDISSIMLSFETSYSLSLYLAAVETNSPQCGHHLEAPNLSSPGNFLKVD